MEQKTGLDKAAYIMLTISMIVTVLCIVALIGISIYGIGVGLGDSNGGGWLIFIVMAMGVVLVPTIISWIAQLILYFHGMRQYKKGNLKTARVLGIINSAVAIFGSLYLCGFMLSGDNWSIGWILLCLIPAAGALYMLIVLILLIISRNKSKLAQI
ncbi:MAG: hypothetical protein E7292_03570 [Lachnospiraceae bacterium]|nr:hypothetical protein [Lachnospiraceae bacterium]